MKIVVILLLVITAGFLYSFNTAIATEFEFSVMGDHYQPDESHLMEEKGMPGVSLGVKSNKNTTHRFNILRGDFLVGNENSQVQTFRWDVERDFTSGNILTPYFVVGVSHYDFDFTTQKDISATAGSTGFGMKVNLSERVDVSVDHRVVVDDILQNDGQMTTARFTVKFGSSDSSATPTIISQAPVSTVVEKTQETPEIQQILVQMFFDINSSIVPLQSLKMLDQVINDSTEIVEVVMIGYASSDGDADYNLLLSEERVKAVRDKFNILVKFVNQNPSILIYAVGEAESSNDAFFDRRVDVIVSFR